MILDPWGQKSHPEGCQRNSGGNGSERTYIDIPRGLSSELEEIKEKVYLDFLEIVSQLL